MAGGRPNMVRADTLDLQDQDAPTASEHSKHHDSDAIAPHQAAQFQHVQEERRSEEETLADAWNMAGQNAEGQAANGQANGEAEEKKTDGTDTANGETEEDTDGDDDDDMMDRMSSSPSIEDGTSAENLLAIGHMSLEGHGTPQHADHERATLNQSPTSDPGSSPFVEIPRHLPLRLDNIYPHSEEPPELTQAESLSPSIYTPEASPTVTRVTFGRFFSATSEHHRLEGKYDTGKNWILDTRGPFEGKYEHATDVSEVLADSPCDRALDQVITSNEVRGSAFAQQQAESVAFKDAMRSNDFNDVRAVNVQSQGFLEQDRFPRSSHPDNGPTNEHAFSEPSTKINTQGDDADTFSYDDDCLIDSSWEGECLQETEDIDFEFVYALHTFVATVEGQANATKGDTMVLLDDSNSYWWLVRVVKDSSIGYLPAEHIETPTERLARLNKHRNIDLSQTMLGDNPEKTRNPLKKAMRRRTAKTVQFAAPTYVEASDYDYSTEDEDGMIDPYSGTAEPQQQEQLSDRGQPAEVEERNAPEEANVHATRRFSSDSMGGSGKGSFDSAGGKASMDSKRSSVDDPQLSPRLVDRSEAAPLKSRKGTPRNADSFLKDESIETRKISLTPGLLRDDTASKSSSTESSRNNNSFETLVKTPSPQEERTKRDSKEKKKDKKSDKKQGGMLSGLFKSKKKDKKSASRDEGELSDMEKVSAEMSRSGQSSTGPSGAVSPIEQMMTSPTSADTRNQARAKLQKAPPTDNSRIMSPIQDEPQQIPQAQQYHPPAGDGFVAELEGSQTAYEMATGDEENLPKPTELEIPPPIQEKSGPLSPIAAMLRSNSMGEPKPKKAKRSKQRVELDDFDSPDEDEQGPNPFLEQEERTRNGSQESDRLSSSPVQVQSPGAGTFMHGTELVHIPQMNASDSESEEGDDTGSLDTDGDKSASTDPSLIEKPTDPAAAISDHNNPATTKPKDLSSDSDATPTAQTPQPTTTRSAPSPDSLPSTADPFADDGRSSPATASTPISSSPRQPTATGSAAPWDDANLRAWFDADDVKDLLAIVQHSAHGAEGERDDAAAEHPAMRGLFEQERKGLEGMMGELDGLLGSFLGRKGVVFT